MLNNGNIAGAPFATSVVVVTVKRLKKWQIGVSKRKHCGKRDKTGWRRVAARSWNWGRVCVFSQLAGVSMVHERGTIPTNSEKTRTRPPTGFITNLRDFDDSTLLSIPLHLPELDDRLFAAKCCWSAQPKYTRAKMCIGRRVVEQ